MCLWYVCGGVHVLREGAGSSGFAAVLGSLRRDLSARVGTRRKVTGRQGPERGPGSRAVGTGKMGLEGRVRSGGEGGG